MPVNWVLKVDEKFWVMNLSSPALQGAAKRINIEAFVADVEIGVLNFPLETVQDRRWSLFMKV